MIDRDKRIYALQYTLKRIELFRKGWVRTLWDETNGQSLGCVFCSLDICQWSNNCPRFHSGGIWNPRICHNRFAIFDLNYCRYNTTWDLNHLEEHCKLELIKLEAK